MNLVFFKKYNVVSFLLLPASKILQLYVVLLSICICKWPHSVHLCRFLDIFVSSRSGHTQSSTDAALSFSNNTSTSLPEKNTSCSNLHCGAAGSIANSGFIQKVKYCFSGLSRTCKTKFQVFQDSQNSFFQGLSRIYLIHKHGCMRSKKCKYQISYQCVAALQ